MKELELNLLDYNLGAEQDHSTTFNIWHKPTGIKYHKPPHLVPGLPTVYTDEQMLFANGVGLEVYEHFKGVLGAMGYPPPLLPLQERTPQIGVFLEPRCIKPIAYEVLEVVPEIAENFEAIFTHDDRLLEMGGVFTEFPLTGGNYILEEDCKIYDKTKQLSIVASEKRSCPGHSLRHRIIERYGEHCDSYGPDYTNLYPQYKDEPADTLRSKYLKITGNLLRVFKDYRYSIVVENMQHKKLFTEKIINCFVTGTIPIYRGAEDIGEYFDERGIISFRGYDDLDRIIPTLGEEDYERRRHPMLNNFDISKKYWSYDDYLGRRIQEVLNG